MYDFEIVPSSRRRRLEFDNEEELERLYEEKERLQKEADEYIDSLHIKNAPIMKKIDDVTKELEKLWNSDASKEEVEKKLNELLK